MFRPYQLDPTLPDDPVPLSQRLLEKFGAQVDAVTQQVESAAAGEGIDLRFDRAQAVNTLTAHRLLRLAEREYGPEIQQKLAEKLFEAHFTNGSNVADPQLLTELAVAAGLERERVVTYLASDEGLTEVRDEIVRAQRLGIRAVPTFVVDGKYAIQGAQPISTFLQLLEEIHQDTAGSNRID